MKYFALALVLALAACAPAPSPEASGQAEGPVFSPGGWQADELGQASGYAPGSRARRMERRDLVGSFTAYDRIWTARPIAKSTAPSPLPRGPAPAIRYDAGGGAQRDINHYLANNPTTALLIARDGRILVERYQYGRRDDMRFTSFSMAKTITSMLFGIALAEGKIRSLDDTPESYVPELKGSEYGRTPLRALLSMSSGVAFREDYGGNDDVSKLVRDGYVGLSPGGPDVLRQFSTRANPPDTKFSYASGETQVLGAVIVAATGRNLADYAGEKIWGPLGTEADASWIIDRAGLEAAFCCFQAVARDWLRLGLMLAHDGAWNGQQIVPRDWVVAATSVDPARGHLAPGKATRFFGYGYQTWIFPGPGRSFALLGVYGQTVYVDPAAKLVMVHLAARATPTDPSGGQTTALWRGVRAAFAGN